MLARMPATCPWHELATYGPPNIKWCEARVCAWVNEPANAWSNLAFIAVALAIVSLNRRAPPAAPALRRFAPTVAVVGLCSFIYHASNTYLTQMLDFLGMYLFCGLLLALNAARLGWLAPRRAIRAALLGALALTAITAVAVRFGAPIQVNIAVLVLLVIVTELRCGPARRGAFLVALALLLAGIVCSFLDATRRWCDPDDHLLQGHALWHLLSALALLAGFVHFRRFDAALARP